MEPNQNRNLQRTNHLQIAMIMKRTTFVFIFLGLILAISNTNAQTSLAARLGYDENAKLLIIHSDDIGVSHSENIGSFLGACDARAYRNAHVTKYPRGPNLKL